MIGALSLLPRYNGGQFFCVVPAHLLHIGLLLNLQEYKVIIIGDTALAVEVLAQYYDQHKTSKPDVIFWLDLENDADNFRRYSLLQGEGITNVELPLFGPAKGKRSLELSGMPGLMQKAQPLCAITEEAIVLNEKGDVLFCPPTEAPVGTANIFNQSFESLFLQKGHCNHRAGRMEICAACDYKGRFQWRKNKNELTAGLLQQGRLMKENRHHSYSPWDTLQFDMYLLTPEEQEKELERFAQRLSNWSGQMNATLAADPTKPLIAIETPVFKGAWLMPCIESILYQSAAQWTYYLLWDGGDELSRRILEIVKKLHHPRLQVFFSENRGIARARHFLSKLSVEEYILPVDDDDMLGQTAVEEFVEAGARHPWSSIIRARRRFIDESGKLVDMPEWFPFESRNYSKGMVTDLHNHCQPALMRRSAYEQTVGWEGFPDFFYAGEDCDIYLKLEEKGSIELIDKLLYFYRLNSQRTSHELKPEGAYEMWRRLADRTIARVGLPLKRSNERPPFEYVQSDAADLKQDMIDFVIPFYEADEEELRYEQGRPSSTSKPEYFELTGYNHFRQHLPEELSGLTRMELLFSTQKHAEGLLRVEVTSISTGQPIATGEATWKGQQEVAKAVSFTLQQLAPPANEPCTISVHFIPARRNYATIRVLYYELEEPKLIARFFKHEKGYSKKVLDRCLLSLQRAGIPDDAIHIVNEKRSSAANRNTGFYRSRKPLVCFLDDDVEITSGDTFRELLKEMAATGADIIGPRLVTPSGKIFCADPFFNKGLRPVPKGIGEQDDGSYQYTSVVPWLPSTLFIVKREVLMAVNGFDEGYAGSQMEDVDFCLKARQRDFKCVYAGSTSVIHYNNQRNDRFAENFERFMLRWKQHPHLFNPVQTTPA